jgi:hypothetical protein
VVESIRDVIFRGCKLLFSEAIFYCCLPISSFAFPIFCLWNAELQLLLVCEIPG